MEGLYVSAVTGAGMDELKVRLEEAITSSTGRVRKTFRIPVGGEHLRLDIKTSDSKYSRFSH
jgi:hypothetical protein